MNKGAPCSCYPEGNDGDCPEHGCIAPTPPSTESERVADLKRQLAGERDHGKRLQQQLDAILRTDSAVNDTQRSDDLLRRALECANSTSSDGYAEIWVHERSGASFDWNEVRTHLGLIDAAHTEKLFHPYCQKCEKPAPSSGGCALPECGIRSAQSETPAMPTGKVLVPWEPTSEMLNRGADAWRTVHENPSSLQGQALRVYLAMIAAAPSPSGVEESK